MTKHYVVKVGKSFKLQHQAAFDDYIQSLPDGGYQLIIEKVRKDRSSQQNRAYHGIVVKILSDHLGYTPAEMHSVLKSKFLKKWVTINGKEYEVIGSTRDLNTVDFNLYVAQIQEWASIELQVVIPDPNQEVL